MQYKVITLAQVGCNVPPTVVVAHPIIYHHSKMICYRIITRQILYVQV
jgi:hypothetical protein